MSFLCSLPLIAGLVNSCPATLTAQAVGYVEGEHVMLAPTETAQLLTLSVRRGDTATPGKVLATLEDADAKIAVAEANAALAQAQAQLANLQEGRRPEEIGVLEASLNSASAETSEAERVAARLSGLSKRGISSQADLDQAMTKLDLARTKIVQAQANLAVARLPARPQEIIAAQQQVKRAEASARAAAWRLSKRQIISPATGVVSDIIRNPGDIVGPQAPVLDILPDGAVKVRLYFPESDFSKLKLGTVLSVKCDGCAPGLEAAVSYVSQTPEFTPPVIYSLENRQKLVFLVEAREIGGKSMLKPGQIIDARIKDPNGG
jgi:HlyD family secretion protein